MPEVRDCTACGEPIRLVDTSCWSCGAPAKKAKRTKPAKVRRARPRVELGGAPVALGLVGGVALVLGSFLPWLVVPGASFSRSGTDLSDGWVTVILGAIAAFLSYQEREKPSGSMKAGLLVLGGLSAIVVVFQFRDMAPFEPGFGLVIAAIGCALVLAAGGLAHRQGR